jgi:antitoxin (DNA-binding transcriptional repressor) of toxin-antitoxin stability system
MTIWVTTMSVKLSLQQLQERLPELLDEMLNTGEEYIVQRDGKDCAVLVSARRWRRRTVAERLDRLGSEYRLSGEKQARAEALLRKNKRQALSPAERSELRALLRECDAIMLRRAHGLGRTP